MSREKDFDAGYREGYAIGHSDGYYNGLAKIIKLAEDAQEVQRLRDSQPAPATRTRKPRKETR